MKNKRVAICATRRADDIAKKVLELGFEPFIEDVVIMEKLPENVMAENIKKALDQEPDVLYFTTGEGTQLIFQKAKELNLDKRLKVLMESGKVFVRGYKARGVLLSEGFKNFIHVESTHDLIEKLKDANISNLRVFIQMYGEKLPDLEAFLLSKGAFVLEVWVYKYQMNLTKMDAFIERLMDGFYSAVLFTSAYQVDYVFKRAEENSKRSELIKALGQFPVIAMGHTTAERLFKHGLTKVLYPEKERLIYALDILEKVLSDG
jgi:uroporphyrinogen-III synthase